jgi:penicillin amidase
MVRLFVLLALRPCLAFTQPNSLQVTGLRLSVEVIRDQYGVNHIYAQNEHDLFFAQGYCAAKDRTFQFEIWRRQATGTTAEIFGTREINRDIGTRLFKFRGNLEQEMNHYHPRGAEIIRAYTEGVNAWIRHTEAHPELLPIEFRLLKIKPGYWTPDVVISRHQGLLGNIRDEIGTARQVARLGPEKVKELNSFEPGEPDLSLDPSITPAMLQQDLIAPYEAYRKALSFLPADLASNANPDPGEYAHLQKADDAAWQERFANESHVIGSNNWVVMGEWSDSRFPLLANDPHRAITAPSLRYLVHLNAPGWNVVGGGEPTIPGVSIGHNDFGAWGLTVFSLDAEDLYVYDLNPANPDQYRYRDHWEAFILIADTIRVKGAPDAHVIHYYTRHGPVTLRDVKNHKAYALRCGWLEPGGAPYMASLRMNQARTWEEFREACSYSHIPGENMVWADRQGNIGWQASGVAPIRPNWSGLVPVPGDGRFEWAGYLPIQSLPHVHNPRKGYWATANENNVPADYGFRNAVGWDWADGFRVNRANEVLGSGQVHSLSSMMALQLDYLSIPARTLVPYLNNLPVGDVRAETARQMLLRWDFRLLPYSVEAAIYVAWEKVISRNIKSLVVPLEGNDVVSSVPLSNIIRWIAEASPVFGSPSVEKRDAFLQLCLEEAVSELSRKLGTDMKGWKYGQEKYHHVLIKHPLSNAVDAETRKLLEVGPHPRGGYGSTVGMTGNSDNQTSGASFRIVVDTQDWDKTLFTNTPGQSGDPSSRFYRNLFSLWASDRHFPVYFSRQKVLLSAAETQILKP